MAKRVMAMDKYFMAFDFIFIIYFLLRLTPILRFVYPKSEKKYAAEPSQAGSASYNTKYKYN